MSSAFIIIAVFVGVATLVGGIALVVRGEGASATEDRLDVLAGNKQTAAASASDEPSLLAQPLNETKGYFEKLASKIGSLKMFLEQADSPLNPSKFIGLSFVLALAGAGLTLITALPVASAPVLALIFGLLPTMYTWWKRRRRLAAFAKQLPEALELISRALRAGHSLASGINLVAEEMSEPISREFGHSYEEQNFGIPLEESLEEMTLRVPNMDLRFFVTAIILQRQTGGDLAEILDKIGRLIRERFRIWGQIQALTGEGRLSGIVLLALPPALFVAMYRLNPKYCQMLFDDPMGHQMLAAAAVMQIIGALVIKKIINIKV